MRLMEKDGMKKFVPDVFVESYKKDGYAVVGEDCVEQPSPDSDASTEDKNSEPEAHCDQYEEEAPQGKPEEAIPEEAPQGKPSQNRNKPSKT